MPIVNRIAAKVQSAARRVAHFNRETWARLWTRNAEELAAPAMRERTNYSGHVGGKSNYAGHYGEQKKTTERRKML